MRPATVLRLAVAGSRVDVVRLVLTTFGAALAILALLAAITVATISPGDGPYTSDLLNQGGLHPGVVIALVGLCVPVLVLLAQCSRIGAPARDRRLAAMRLGGATPGEVGRIVAVDSGVGALIGSLLGAAVYFLLRVVLDQRVTGPYSAYLADTRVSGTLDGPGFAYRLPTDVLPPWWAVVVVVLAVPFAVVVATTFALRRVAFTPFGVTRRVRTTPPRVLPLVLVAVGVGGFFGVAALLEAVEVPGGLVLALLIAGFVLTAVGLLSGQAAITQAIGRFVVGRTSRPALLLAGRRMIADPFAATRATAVLCVTVLIAAGTRHFVNVTNAMAPVGQEPDPFYANAATLVDLVLLLAGGLAALGLLVAAAEGIVARRRTYAAVVAAGTPRAVVARAVVAETVLPLVPSLLVATIAGTAAAMGFFGRTADSYDEATNTPVRVAIGVAWGPLALTLLLAVGITALATALGLVFLRSATDIGELRAAA